LPCNEITHFLPDGPLMAENLTAWPFDAAVSERIDVVPDSAPVSASNLVCGFNAWAVINPTANRPSKNMMSKLWLEKDLNH
jgi:hypothetical protein